VQNKSRAAGVKRLAVISVAFCEAIGCKKLQSRDLKPQAAATGGSAIVDSYYLQIIYKYFK
jgi:hypothetical protein